MLRILHTADWQLGRPFGNVPGDAGAVLREARFEAVRTIARLATEHEVDAVLVAGDVFDDRQPAEQTLLRALAAMRGFDGAWVLLPGNHDAALAAGIWTRLASLGLPANVRPVTEAVSLSLCDGRLVILPAPLTERRTTDDLTAWMDRAETPAASVRVGLAHGSVVGRLPEAADAGNPIAPDRATRARLDYLALGDWHGTIEIEPRAWYAGTPEPDRAKDNDSGNALLVEIAAPGALPRVTRLKVGKFAWHGVAADCTVGDPAETVRRALTAVPDPAHALVFLRLTGLIGVAGGEAVDTVTATAAAAFHHLEVDRRGLRMEPGEAELKQLADHPVLGRVAAALAAQLAVGDGEEREAAGLALRLLWREQTRVGAPV